MNSDLIQLTDRGLYCERGKFYIDAWKPVDLCLVTHGHSDHAHYGHGRYICSLTGVEVTRQRVGHDAKIQGIPYGESFTLGEVKVSLHPAGHILGSAQVRVEYGGEVWVFTGDCKRDFDPSCEPFEVLKCDTFITEATFALPIYHWRKTSEVARDIHEWWMTNRAREMNSVLCVYSLGKAQRVLAELKQFTNDPVYLHGAAVRLTQAYRDAGIPMLETIPVSTLEPKQKLKGEFILAPPSASGSTWMRRFEPYEVGFASGWMTVRGNRRRDAYDRGFVISDHSDWPSLIQTIRETGAKRILATHGSSDILARYVTEEMGLKGEVLRTSFSDTDTDPDANLSDANDDKASGTLLLPKTKKTRGKRSDNDSGKAPGKESSNGSVKESNNESAGDSAL